VNVFDENNCPSGTNAIVIANPATLFASVSQSSPVTCYNGNNGALTVNAEGGTGSYTYSLNGGLAQSVSEFSSLTAGSYTVVISDEFGCSASSSLLISSPEPVTVSAQQSQVNCFGAFDATLSVNAAGGTPPYAYSIDGGQTYQYTNSFDSLKAGTFNIMVYDANNCPAQAFSFNVVQSSPIVANVNVVSGNKCFGSNDASAEINIQEGIFPLTYSLDHGSYFTNGLMEGLSAGHHTIRILDSLGCGIETDFFIEPQLPIVIDLISSSYADCSGKRDGSIGIEANGGQGPFSYSWSNGQSSSNIEGLSIGEYVVTVTDELGCTSTFSKLVTVGPVETPLEMNNAFSPNGDGINDLWVIENLELYPDNQLVIINRWGNEVLTVNGYKNNWDGSQLNEGTYFYILKVNMCDEDKTFDGYITILR
jgi:gliding motility-associated-like protein